MSLWGCACGTPFIQITQPTRGFLCSSLAAVEAALESGERQGKRAWGFTFCRFVLPPNSFVCASTLIFPSLSHTHQMRRNFGHHSDMIPCAHACHTSLHALKKIVPLSARLQGEEPEAPERAAMPHRFRLFLLPQSPLSYVNIIV